MPLICLKLRDKSVSLSDSKMTIVNKSFSILRYQFFDKIFFVLIARFALWHLWYQEIGPGIWDCSQNTTLSVRVVAVVGLSANWIWSFAKNGMIFILSASLCTIFLLAWKIFHCYNSKSLIHFQEEKLVLTLITLNFCLKQKVIMDKETLKIVV